MADVSPLAILPGCCSNSHQSLLRLSPSTWWAAVAVPQRNPSGNRPRGTDGNFCSRHGARGIANFRRGDVLPGDRLVAFQVDLEHPGSVDRLAVELPLAVRSAVEEDPHGLERVGVAH